MLGKVKKLVTHLDSRGYLYEMLRCDDDVFTKFGQSYISVINPGMVKGFHKHSKQTDYIVCVTGQVKLVLIGEKGGGWEIEEHHLSPLDPKMVIVPTEIYHGWSCVGNEPAVLVCFSTHPFDPTNPDEHFVDPHKNVWGYVWG